MRLVRVFYAAGVVSVSAGVSGVFVAPEFLGLIPLGAGLIWAAYDLTEVDGGKPPTAPKQ